MYRVRGKAPTTSAFIMLPWMRVEDYYRQGKRWWVRLHEKGGKRHEMPAHHTLEAYLDTYIEAAGVRDGGKTPSFAPPPAAPAH